MLPGWMLEAGTVAGAIADTVAAGSGHTPLAGFVGMLGRDLPFTEQVEQWHEFYLMAGTAAGIAAALYVPALQDIFRFAPLGAADLAICGGTAIAGLIWFEAYKLVRRRALMTA